LLPAGAVQAGEPMLLEAKIPLGKVGGRIDHFAIDLERRRLFVAELGNNSVGVIDLQTILFDQVLCIANQLKTSE
jgi:hypothetical protein